jgi:hypothetical protein
MGALHVLAGLAIIVTLGYFAVSWAITAAAFRLITRGTCHCGQSARSSIPALATLPLDSDAGGIADLDPNRARAGSIGAVYPLGDDAFGTKLAGVREDSRPQMEP